MNDSYHIPCWMNDRDSIYLRGVESIYEVKIDRKLKCIVYGFTVMPHSERFFVHDKVRSAHDVRLTEYEQQDTTTRQMQLIFTSIWFNLKPCRSSKLESVLYPPV